MKANASLHPHNRSCRHVLQVCTVVHSKLWLIASLPTSSKVNPGFIRSYSLCSQVDDVDEVLSNINEQNDAMEQINAAMGQPIGPSADIDEDDLEREFEVRARIFWNICADTVTLLLCQHLMWAPSAPPPTSTRTTWKGSSRCGPEPIATYCISRLYQHLMRMVHSEFRAGWASETGARF